MGYDKYYLSTTEYQLKSQADYIYNKKIKSIIKRFINKIKEMLEYER